MGVTNFYEDLRKWFDKNHPEGGWKRINSKGEAIGPCAREKGEPKPKCMSNKKREQLTKNQRASAVAAKRKHDPNPERKGKPINVSNFGKGKISEDIVQIDEKNEPTNPKLWAKAKSLARQKFDVYPSAYANGWAAKWYKSKGGGWKSISEEYLNERGADSKGYYRSTESGAGLTRKGAKHFGIQTAVTGKVKPGSKAAKRRKSFCARMSGMPGPMKDEKGRPTRKAASLRRWRCRVSEEVATSAMPANRTGSLTSTDANTVGSLGAFDIIKQMIRRKKRMIRRKKPKKK